MLTGLRGVGKTVLLNALRSAAVRRGWGTGKLEARPGPVAAPAAGAGGAHGAAASSRHRDQDSGRPCSGVLKAFALRDAGAGRKVRDRWQPGIDVAGHDRAAPTPATSRSTWSSCSPTSAGLAARPRAGASRSSSTRCRTCGPTTCRRSARPATRSAQQGAPLVVVGAGLPHLPAVLARDKSYAERLFRYAAHRPARPRGGRPGAASSPAARRGRRRTTPGALDELYAATDGYPYFVQAYGKVTWDVAAALPDHGGRRRASAAPEAEAELAVGFFGSRYERATPAEREYMRAMAEPRRAEAARPTSASVPTADVAQVARPQAAVAVAGARRADQEGPGLLRRARPHRVHRAALRPVPASHGRLTVSAQRCARQRHREPDHRRGPRRPHRGRRCDGATARRGRRPQPREWPCSGCRRCGRDGGIGRDRSGGRGQRASPRGI